MTKNQLKHLIKECINELSYNQSSDTFGGRKDDVNLLIKTRNQIIRDIENSDDPNLLLNFHEAPEYMEFNLINERDFIISVETLLSHSKDKDHIDAEEFFKSVKGQRIYSSCLKHLERKAKIMIEKEFSDSLYKKSGKTEVRIETGFDDRPHFLSMDFLTHTLDDCVLTYDDDTWNVPVVINFLKNFIQKTIKIRRELEKESMNFVVSIKNHIK